MKADESRSPVPVKHEHEHEIPTVIHHPEEDLPLLARWFHKMLANPVQFWGLVVAVAAVTLLLSFLGSGMTIGGAPTVQAWSKLETAKSAAERVEIAKDFPKTDAERWALLQAASEYFSQGFNDLPANKDAALPNLKKALDLYQRVYEESPDEAPQKRIAAFGLARTYEARNDLPKAIAQYRKVAEFKPWGGTDEALNSAKLVKLLESPEAVGFYKDLYAYSPTQATLPAGGIGNLPLSFPDNHPPLNGPTVPTGTSPFTVPTPGGSSDPNPLNLPPPPPTPATKGDTGKMPLELFNPPTPTPKAADAPTVEAPKAEPPKADAPKAEAPKADAGLPAEVFSGDKNAKPK